MDGTVVLALDQCSPTSLEGVCLQVFKTMTEDMMGDSVDVFLQAQEEFMRRLKEFIPDSRDTIPVIQSELSTDEQIQVLMEVRNELLHESQELLERYKYLSQKIDETWVQYQQLQLKLSQPPQPTQ